MVLGFWLILFKIKTKPNVLLQVNKEHEKHNQSFYEKVLTSDRKYDF